MIPSDLFYAFPSAAYLGVLVLLIAFSFWALYQYRKRFESSFSPDLYSQVAIKRVNPFFMLKAIAVCLVWVAATVALMQPEGNGHYPTELNKPPEEEKEGIIQRRAHDVIFLVDASASMTVPDSREGLTRFEYAKEIVDEIVSRLRGENAALYAFTSVTTKLSPLTMDYLFVRMMLKQMQINEGDAAGTDLFQAIAKMRDTYFSFITPTRKSLIIVTDGGDTHIESLTGAEREQAIESLLSLLNGASELNLEVYTIGMGSLEGKTIPGITFEANPVHSAVEEGLLKQISQKGGGKYFFANGTNAMDLARDLVNDMTKRPTQIEEFKVRTQGEVKGSEDLIYDLFFQFPLGLALILLGFVLSFPDTWKKAA